MGLAEFGGRGHSWALQGSCLPLIPSVWGRNGPPAPGGKFALAEDLTQPLAQNSPPSLLSLSRGSLAWPLASSFLPASFSPYHAPSSSPSIQCHLSACPLWHSGCATGTGHPVSIWHPGP